MPRPSPRADSGGRNGRKKGGLEDRRRLWCNLDDAEYIREKLNFPDFQIGLRVDRELIDAKGAVVSRETRYLATSSDPNRVSAAQLLARVRSHWQIENSLFFLKDRWWDEDRHHTRRPGLGEVLAKLTSFAATVLRALYPPELPIRARADHIQWKPTLGLELLGFK